MYNNRRKLKNKHNALAKTLRYGTYCIGCDSAPALIIATYITPDDIHGSNIDIKSLIDGSYGCCSLLHCVPESISKDEAHARANHIKSDGYDEQYYLKFYGEASQLEYKAWNVSQEIHHSFKKQPTVDAALFNLVNSHIDQTLENKPNPVLNFIEPKGDLIGNQSYHFTEKDINSVPGIFTDCNKTDKEIFAKLGGMECEVIVVNLNMRILPNIVMDFDQ